jgi:hypothetical protein
MPIRKSRAGRWIAGMLALLILFGAIGILLWNQRANIPFLSRPVTTKTPIATSTSSRTFTPTPSPTITPSPTLTPIPPTPTPTPTGTPDLREKNPGNQHLYLLVETPQFWHDARDTCASWGGHLATIQDYNENVFVYRLSSRVPYGTWPWLGATDEVQDGKWVWVTGEPWSWTIWDHIYDPDGIPSSNTYNYLTFSDHQNLEWSYLFDGAAPFICEWEIPSP